MISLSALLVAAPGHSQTPRSTGSTYTVTALGNVAGNGALFSALDINNAGVVVGSAQTAANQTHAYRRNVEGALEDLGTPGGSTSSAAAINASGQIAATGTDGMNVTRPYRQTGGDRLLLPFTGSADGINDTGSWVGQRFSDSAAYISDGTNTTFLAFLPNALSMQAFGLTDDGTVVGQANYSNAGTSAFKWNAGSFTALPALGGAAQNASAVAINESGVAVGDSVDGMGRYRATQWIGTTPSDLGELMAGGSSFASDINESGEIVGAARVASMAEFQHAFIVQNGTMVDLNTCIPANSGWVLQNASDVNDAGEIIGSGLFNGQFRSFLLTPTSLPAQITRVVPNTRAPGQGGDLIIYGRGFKSGAQVSLGAGIAIVNLSVLNPNMLVMGATVDANATPGLRDVTVTNPGESPVVAVGAFAVTGTVTPPAALSKFTLSSASVKGGSVLTVNVTLDRVAESGGVAVTFASTNSALKVPAGFTIPQGRTRLQTAPKFKTNKVRRTTSYTLTATAGGVSKSFKLKLKP